MAKTSDVAAYFCANYPHKSELSKTRLTKLVYLADWAAAQELGHQITDIKWFFHNFGPFVDDVYEATAKDARFEEINTKNFYGDQKLIINIKSHIQDTGALKDEEKKILDEVIDQTKSLQWNNLIKHVYATKPIADSDRYNELDLISFAGEFEN